MMREKTLFTAMGEYLTQNFQMYKEGPFIIFESADTDKISITNPSNIKDLIFGGG